MNFNFKRLVFACLMLFFSSLGYVRGQNVDEPAPDFTLEMYNGGNFRLSEQNGKVVFIFLFGYGCPFCIQNAPYIESELYQKLKDNDNFVAVAADLWDGGSSQIEGFLNSSGITFPILINGSGLKYSYDTYWDNVLVIDKEGILRYKSIEQAGVNEVDSAYKIINNLFNPLSINKTHKTNHQISIYPNPANDFTTIKCPLFNKPDTRIKIINTIGEVVFEKKIISTSETYKLNVANLKERVYFMQVINNTNILSKRLIVTKKIATQNL